MISIAQIKAGRALLSWDQATLAQKARISLPALSNLERGAVEPRQRTVEAVHRALEDAGIEFIAEAGVVRRQDVLTVRMLDGKKAIEELFQDIYETLSVSGGDLLASGLSEEQFLSFASRSLFRYLRKAYLHRRIRGRILIREGDTRLVGDPEKSLYRWVEKESFGLVPYYIYKDKYAVVSWGPPTRVIIVQNQALAETHRRQFEKDWQRASLPPNDIPRIWPDERAEKTNAGKKRKQKKDRSVRG